MIDLCTQIKFKIPDLDKYGPPRNKSISKQHHAHLVIESSEQIMLKVYYDESTSLADKVLRWEGKQSKTSLPQKIEFVKINKSNLLSINLKDSVVKTTQMSIGNSLFDPGIGKYFTITFDRVELIYKDEYQENSGKSFVELNDIYVKPLKEFYFTSSFANSSRDTWSAKSRHKTFKKFSQVNYNIRYGFETKSNDDNNETIIKRRPFIFLKHKELSKEIIIEHINELIGIIGFYYNAGCYSPNYTIYTKNRKYQFFSINKDIIKYAPRSILRNFEERFDIFQFIRKCKKLDSINQNSMIKIIDRFNLASAIEGEARFMIFYELFERLKSKSVDQNEKVNIQYDTNLSKRQKSNFIKKLAKEFSSIFNESNIEKIQNTFIQRVSNIKYKSLGNQYEIFIKQLKLDIPHWLPIIQKANDYRDILFHGGSIDIDDDEFLNSTFNLKDMVALLIANELGVKLNIEK